MNRAAWSSAVRRRKERNLQPSAMKDSSRPLNQDQPAFALNKHPWYDPCFSYHYRQASHSAIVHGAYEPTKRVEYPEAVMQSQKVLCLASLFTCFTLAACDQTMTSPTSSVVRSPAAALAVPVGTPGGTVDTATAGQVTVCKTAASSTTYGVPSNTAFTYNVAVSYPENVVQSQDQYVSSVTLMPGQCATVYYRPSTSSPVGGYEYVALVSVTEQPLTGYLLQNLSYATASTGPINTTFNGVSYPRQSGSTVELLANYFHGYVVNYTNAVDGGFGGAGEPDSTSGCVYSQGYYKTHTAAVQTILSNPANSGTPYLSGGMLVIGGEPLLSASMIESYLGRPTRGDARIIVERQLIAAELSILSGASASSTIVSEISEANTLLAKSTLTSAEKTRLKEIAGDLDSYNNGTTGVTANAAHCSE
jgi:hypothetical protein